MGRSNMIVLGVDVGGTFTDLILADLAKKTLAIHKTASTPPNSVEGLLFVRCTRQF